MPMRATTVRFGEDLWELLEREAAGQGISAAQFVRDAALLRLGALGAHRGGPTATTLEELAAGALSRRQPAAAEGVRSPSRLAALQRTGLLDSAREEAFDRLASLAAKLLYAPVALVSLVDENRQFFKSSIGLDEPWAGARETPLSHSFCQHTLVAGEVLVIEDARSHPLVRDNLAIRDLKVIAYIGIPLVVSDGEVLGTLCVIDHKPRAWTRDQVETLCDLAASVVSEIELRATSAA